jgi:hypothetical protein
VVHNSEIESVVDSKQKSGEGAQWVSFVPRCATLRHSSPRYASLRHGRRACDVLRHAKPFCAMPLSRWAEVTAYARTWQRKH